jgi:hypothetical protein
MSCSHNDYTLEESVFVPDEKYYDLPAYSELGYNTFGAHIDRQTFVYDQYENAIPSKIIVRQDTLNLQLIGKLNYENITLNFALIGYSPITYTDITSLHGKTFDLTDKKQCIISLTRNGSIKELNVLNGKLEIITAKPLYVNSEIQPAKTVIAGKFQFQFMIDNEPQTADKGRFDFGIGYDNFYSFQ